MAPSVALIDMCLGCGLPMQPGEFYRLHTVEGGIELQWGAAFGMQFGVQLSALCQLPWIGAPCPSRRGELPFGNSLQQCDSLSLWMDGTKLWWDRVWRQWPLAVACCVQANRDVHGWDQANILKVEMETEHECGDGLVHE